MMPRLRTLRNTARIKKERERSFACAMEALRSEFTSAVQRGAKPERFCLQTLPFRLSVTVQWVNFDPTGYGQSGTLLNVEDEYMLEIATKLLSELRKLRAQMQPKVIGAAA